MTGVGFLARRSGRQPGQAHGMRRVGNGCYGLFPVPWKITDTGSAFKITDARGRPVAWCYYRRESALRNEYPSREEAEEMAKNIARLWSA
jgi:hypothetical protein